MLDIGVVGENVLRGHSGCQQLEEELHRIPQAPNCRPTMAHVGVGNDAIQPRHEGKATSRNSGHCRKAGYGQMISLEIAPASTPSSLLVSVWTNSPGPRSHSVTECSAGSAMISSATPCSK